MKTGASITIEAVQELMKGTESLFFLDVRNHRQRDWSVVKVRGAIRLPDDEVERHLGDIPRGETIIVYSSGTGDEYSEQAVELLRRHGWKNAFYLVGGFNAYLDAGLPVEEFGMGSKARSIRGL